MTGGEVSLGSFTLPRDNEWAPTTISLSDRVEIELLRHSRTGSTRAKGRSWWNSPKAIHESGRKLFRVSGWNAVGWILASFCRWLRALSAFFPPDTGTSDRNDIRRFLIPLTYGVGEWGSGEQWSNGVVEWWSGGVME